MNVDYTVDVVTESEVRGWAWMPDKAHTALSIDLRDSDEQVRATVVAAGYRDDLARAGKRGGWCAFTLMFPPRLADGAYRIVARDGAATIPLGAPFERREAVVPERRPPDPAPATARWRGEPTGVAPDDLIAIQALLWDRRPAVVVLRDDAPGLRSYIASILPALDLADTLLLDGDAAPEPSGSVMLVRSGDAVSPDVGEADSLIVLTDTAGGADAAVERLFEGGTVFVRDPAYGPGTRSIFLKRRDRPD